MELDKNKCDKSPKSSPITFRNLSFISCIFFSDRQYNQDKIHKPQYSLCIDNSFVSTSLNSIENEIDNMIDNVYNKLNENNNIGYPIKIPEPIYILLGRELEYDSSILETERFVHFPSNGISKLGNAEIQPDNNGTLAILDYLNSFFNYSGFATTEDKKKYEKSHLNNYKFKGKIKILLYIPYLSNEYRYITNFQDIYNSSTFFYNLIMSDVFLKFERTANIDKDFINNLKKMNFNRSFIELLTKILRDASKSKFVLYDDLNNLCFEGGCVTTVGEDLKVLVPKYDKDDGTNQENAVKFSPYLPNKCLSKTKNFLCNVKYAKDYNKGMDEFVKKYAMADIINGLGEYSKINDMINNKKINQEDVNKIDKFKSPLNLIISVINSHIKDGYSSDLRDEEREIIVKEDTSDCKSKDTKIKVKYNHYSKEYSENIIKELSLLNDKYPGVPEIVMSFYTYNYDLKRNKIIKMPWGGELISSDYLFNMYSPLDVDNIIYSFNNRYGLKLNKSGLIFVYEIKTNRIIYFINDIPVLSNGILSVLFDKTSFSIQINDNDNNQRKGVIKKNIPKLISECDLCQEPITMIIDDNDGSLRFYGNSFYDVTNSEFKNFIGNQKNLVGNFNINELDSDKYNNDLKKKLEESSNPKSKQNYQYCYDINGSCLK